MIFEFILAHRDDRFQVGVNEAMDKAQAHGAAKVVDAQGNLRSVPFKVDYPKRIQNPTKDQVKKLFQQLDQLGYYAETVIVGRDERQCSFRRTACLT